MPLKTLAKLITTYRWLLAERDAQLKANAEANALYIDKEIDELFLRIVRFPTDDPRISGAQIEFLVTSLVEEEHAPMARAVLRESILQHVARLVGTAGDNVTAGARSLDGCKV